MSSNKGRIQKAGQATIQQWITATEQMVMGTRKLTEMLAERLNLVAERQHESTQRLEELEKVVATLVKETYGEDGSGDS